MEISLKLGPLSVSAPEIWLAAQTPNYKISFLIRVPLTSSRYTDTGREWVERMQTLTYALRSEANIMNYQPHPWANYLTCMSLFLHF